MHAARHSNLYICLWEEEPYYIDLITDEIVRNALSDDERDFNQTIVYGADCDMPAILDGCPPLPMMAERQLVVVNEMQMDAQQSTILLLYLQNPQPTTVLVLNYKNGTLKNKKIVAEISRQGIVYESKRIYDSQLLAFESGYTHDKNIAIDDRASGMLCEAIGANLSRLAGELDKLSVLLSLSGEKRITADMVELHIGHQQGVQQQRADKGPVSARSLEGQPHYKILRTKFKIGPALHCLRFVVYLFFQSSVAALFAVSQEQQRHHVGVGGKLVCCRRLCQRPPSLQGLQVCRDYFGYTTLRCPLKRSGVCSRHIDMRSAARTRFQNHALT